MYLPYSLINFFFSIANQFYANVAFVEMLISISYIFFVLDDLWIDFYIIVINDT